MTTSENEDDVKVGESLQDASKKIIITPTEAPYPGPSSPQAEKVKEGGSKAIKTIQLIFASTPSLDPGSTDTNQLC